MRTTRDMIVHGQRVRDLTWHSFQALIMQNGLQPALEWARVVWGDQEWTKRMRS